MKNGFMLKHGRAGDSTQGSTSSMSKELHVKKAHIMEAEELATAVLGRNASSVVFVLDDFSGSGMHLLSTVEQFVSLLDRQRHDWHELVEIVVGAAVVANPVEVRGPHQDRTSIHHVSGTTLGDRFRPFSAAAGVFANERDRTAAEDLVTAIGRSLMPNSPLGFGGEAILALLEFNCPNTAAPIFWKEGVYGGNPWHALFPRQF